MSGSDDKLVDLVTSRMDRFDEKLDKFQERIDHKFDEFDSRLRDVEEVCVRAEDFVTGEELARAEERVGKESRQGGSKPWSPERSFFRNPPKQLRVSVPTFARSVERELSPRRQEWRKH